MLIFFLGCFVTGCVTKVPMDTDENAITLKQFSTPKENKAGLFIYRVGAWGGAVRKSIWVDGECVGDTAPNMFFYHEVDEGEHTISTESEFSPNEIKRVFEKGKNYFIRQFMKMGVFVAGAGLEFVDEEVGKADVRALGLALKGKCARY